ncbi:hypothetical protein BJV82DRAFT_577247 [Fennellomyces sp. T-0311]|nr:hypothetical protein BJV82DRAFT_577247 [Fennellomyces sp. T-0311]
MENVLIILPFVLYLYDTSASRTDVCQVNQSEQQRMPSSRTSQDSVYDADNALPINVASSRTTPSHTSIQMNHSERNITSQGTTNTVGAVGSSNEQPACDVEAPKAATVRKPKRPPPPPTRVVTRSQKHVAPNAVSQSTPKKQRKRRSG